MNVFPNARVLVERPIRSEDELGDPVDTWETTFHSLGLALAERRRRVWNPSESRSETMVFYEALAPVASDLAEGDRFTDLHTGDVLHVTYVREARHPAVGATLRIELEKQ